MAQKKSSTTGFRKQLLAELQSNVRGGLKRVSGNEILLTPLMDVYETGKEYVLVFAVPGMAKEDVDVRIVGNELIVEEKKGIAKKAYGETVIKELENGRYCRKIQLTAEIDEKSATLQAKIRDATLQKIPLLGIIGLKEVESESISARSRRRRSEETISFPEVSLR